MSREPAPGDAFAAAMAAMGPFEPAPRLAVAVSGGPDSSALALLADRWAGARRGDILALIVDHALRPESGAEARGTADRLARRGIRSEVLTRTGPTPAAGIQDFAREARYALLGAACARHGILHLLTGHTREDQAETVLQRLARGSGIDGLAGMPAVRETGWGRVIRPLLAVPKAALSALCGEAGMVTVDDPANRDPRHARARLRAAEASLAAEGFSVGRLAATAAKAGRARAALDGAVADLLARAASLQPEGWIVLDRRVIAAAPEETMRRAVARCLSAVGGRGGPPARGERLDRLVAALRRGGPGGGPGGGPEGGLGGGRTLAGCRILPRGAGGARLAICREDAAAERRTIEGPGVADWDGRFRVTVSPDLWDFAARAGPCRLVPAGPAAPTRMATLGVPAAARRALPALEAGGRIVATAEFDGRNATPVSDSLLVLEAVWRPPEAMAGPGFGIA